MIQKKLDSESELKIDLDDDQEAEIVVNDQAQIQSDQAIDISSGVHSMNDQT